MSLILVSHLSVALMAIVEQDGDTVSFVLGPPNKEALKLVAGLKRRGLAYTRTINRVLHVYPTELGDQYYREHCLPSKRAIEAAGLVGTEKLP